MRNLGLIDASTWPAPSSSAASSSRSQHPFHALAISPTSRVYAVSASPSDQGLTTFGIYSLTRLSKTLLSSFAAPSKPTDEPLLSQGRKRPDLESSPASQSQVRSLTYLSDGGSEADYQPALCLVTAGGDIALLPLLDDDEDDAPAVDPREPIIVGSVEQGILAAQWSPDQELLVLVTARESEDKGEQILLMTREWEVLGEQALEVDQFGEEVPINVGWGSKATQFHGSEGKQAAAAAAEAASKTGLASKTSSRGPHVPDDDGLPRVSWRGDGAYFAISSLEAFVPPVSDVDKEEQTWHRVIRTYSRMASLSATSDPSARGIGQSLSFKPTGILMATTQRFGGAFASGRTGRHDVALFERNGLRHGEFCLREEERSLPREGTFEQLEDSAKAATGESWSREHRVREVAWNADGSALAVWIHRSAASATDVVQIWVMGNYHYYLKAELALPSSSSSSVLQSVAWHPEEPLSIYLLSQRSVHGFDFIRETVVSGGEMPHDAACVAVQDGTSVKLTPLRLQNVPPPMASFTLIPAAHLPAEEGKELSSQTPVQLAWADVSLPSAKDAKADSCSLLAVLYRDGTTLLFKLHWGLIPRTTPVGGHRLPTPEYVGRVRLGGERGFDQAVQVALAGARREGAKIDAVVAVLGREKSVSTPVISAARCIVEGGKGAAVIEEKRTELDKDGKARIFARTPSTELPPETFWNMIWVQERDGTLRSLGGGEAGRLPVDEASEDGEEGPSSVDKLRSFCPQIAFLSASSSSDAAESRRPIVVGLSTTGQLLADDVVVAKDATSFAVSGDFVIWTNAAHEARFLPVSALASSSAGASGEDGEAMALPGAEVIADKGDTRGKELVSIGRRVERTSLIVAAIPSSMSLVLQHSRGNLETICPRPLVLQVVRRCLDLLSFASALGICRTHRLDLNILYDHCPTSFEGNVERFVRQIRNREHLNAFIQALRDEDVAKTLYRPIGTATSSDSSAAPGKVNRVCALLRAHLETIPGNDHLTSIVTCYVSQRPPDYVGGLTLLRRLKEEQPTSDVADETAKYLCWLTDADRLFDAALGMYDFVLPLMVAQYSERKDPREYLPFLRELRALQPREYQRFRIDDHLARYSVALRWLAQAGEERHDEAVQYMVQHELFEEGLEAWASHPAHLRQAYALYGEWLAVSGRAKEAADAFNLAGDDEREVEAHREAGQWRDALAAAHRGRFDQQRIRDLVDDLADSLESDKRFAEAAELLATYVPTEKGRAVSLYAKGGECAEAFRIVSQEGDEMKELVDTAIRPVLLDIAQQLLADVEDMTSQLEKTMTRLGELRQRKKERPEDFYAGVDDGTLDADARSEAASRISGFSGFTQFSRFTRMTGASNALSAFSNAGLTQGTGTSAGGKSRQSSKTRRKERKKKITGKKGSVYEEDYLFESLARLVRERLAKVQDEVGSLLPYLLRLGGDSSSLSTASTLRDGLIMFEHGVLTSLNALLAAVKAEYLSIEEARLDALREATEVGIGKGGLRWEDLQMAGLFAPQKGRNEMVAAMVESVGGTTVVASVGDNGGRSLNSSRNAPRLRWRSEVLDALRPPPSVDA